MSTVVTVSLNVTPAQAKRLLDFYTTLRGDDPGTTNARDKAQSLEPVPFQVMPDELSLKFRHLLHGESEQLVRFILGKGPQFYNDELAKELGVEDAGYTAFGLGRVTRKLQRIGLPLEGFRGANWYEKESVRGRTLITVRRDVFELFKKAMGAHS